MRPSRIIYGAVLMLTSFALLSFLTIERNPAPENLNQIVTDWERAKAYTLDYLNAANDDVINFKPTPEMRSFGQQMLHIAEANYGLGALAFGKPSPITWGQLEKSDKYTTKEEVSKAVMESYDFMISNAKGLTEAQLSEMVKVFNFDMNRATALSKVFEHQTHHRGQTTVYLRLKGIKPPNERLF